MVSLTPVRNFGVFDWIGYHISRIGYGGLPDFTFGPNAEIQRFNRPGRIVAPTGPVALVRYFNGCCGEFAIQPGDKDAPTMEFVVTILTVSVPLAALLRTRSFPFSRESYPFSVKGYDSLDIATSLSLVTNF